MSAKAKSKARPKLTDAERLARFKEMAREVDASEDAADFDRAFMAVTQAPPKPPGERP